MKKIKQVLWYGEDRPCPVCHSRKARILGSRGGPSHHRGEGVATHIVRSCDCDTVYQSPTLLPESNPYAAYSDQEYFKGHHAENKILNGERLAAFAEQILGKPGKMLELGCGRGELLKGAANRGWEVYGVEMTEGFAKVAQSHDIEVEYASIETCTSLEKVYDAVLLAAVLEHLYDPMETLIKVREAIRPGGLLFIDVPNEGSLVTRIGNTYMRLRGRDWAINLSPTFPPFHVVGFSPSSLRYLLHSTGFRPFSLELHRWSNELPKVKDIRARLEHKGLDVVQFIGGLIGMGDGITCWAIRD
ncbi:class I SAM-dependent methyltransferase [Phormidium pseudopriestleyi FRX01]|uniref:Class I SAM-dependent methyltransferase n=1 Tax=Phormidium pseudopriestleyi FRX01 TaxID=1759528 RepID=A0ABS3FL71_9CYAN|nr:class I SAM-dependent methyltransferase [Phormidium pseudopriestleyi]MBO0347856.1 class I SAM-dependent methyltransferase [Phormidium pseudopriestleyi FRX01]